MFLTLPQDPCKSRAIKRFVKARIIIVIVISFGCLCEQAKGDDLAARQRFFVEVSGVVLMKSAPTHAGSQTSRMEISSASELVLALSSTEQSASISDAVFLLQSGQTCHVSIHRGSAPLRTQTVSVSGLPCLEFSAEATAVLTISAI